MKSLTAPIILESLRDHFRTAGYRAEVVQAYSRKGSMFPPIQKGPLVLHVALQVDTKLPIEITLRDGRLGLPRWRKWSAETGPGDLTWMKFLNGEHYEYVPLCDPDAVERVEAFVREILGA